MVLFRGLIVKCVGHFCIVFYVIIYNYNIF